MIKKRYLVIGYVLVAIAVAYLGLAGRVKPIALNEDLLVAKNGSVHQGKNLVGQFTKDGDTVVLNLPVAQNRKDSVSAYFAMALPVDVPAGKAAFSVLSIQGSGNFSLSQQGARTVVADLPSIVPESHTSLRIVLPAEGFSISPIVQLRSLLAAMPFAAWLVLSALLLAGVGVYMIVRVRAVSIAERGIANQPPDVSPAEFGVMLHGQLTPQDISAILYDFARRGLLQIIQHPEDTLFLWTGKKGRMAVYELVLLAFITQEQTKPRSLKSIVEGLEQSMFSSVVSSTYIELYEGMCRKGYLGRDIRATHLYFKTLGILVQLSSLVLAIGAYIGYGRSQAGLVVLGIAGYMSGWIFYKAGYKVTPLSEYGFALRRNCLAFRNFLASPVPLPNGPKNSQWFYQYLPYAIAAGVQEAWFARFSVSNVTVPGWFVSQEDFMKPERFIEEVNKVNEQLVSVFVTVKDPNVD